MSITVHMAVKNEDSFVWYALRSVEPFADKILVTDTGSGDLTVDQIKSINSRKIEFIQKEVNSPEDMSQVREEQLKKTETDWIWIVDGDEVYPSGLCEEITGIIKQRGDELTGIVCKRFDLLGDIYHRQLESVGQYSLLGRKGHIVLRLINRKKVPGLHIEGLYPYEGYYDVNGVQLTDYSSSSFEFTKGRIYHAMYLKRSSKGGVLEGTLHRNKYKTEKGLRIEGPLPEVFSYPRPSNVPDMTGKRGMGYEIKATFVTPVKKMKRLIMRTRNQD